MLLKYKEKKEKIGKTANKRELEIGRYIFALFVELKSLYISNN